MTIQINQALDELMQVVAEQQPKTEYDEQWESPCQQGQPDAQGNINWHPQLQNETVDWSGFKSALGIDVPASVQAYYSRYFADTIKVTLPRGDVFLLHPWNADDRLRLQQNLVAHLMMKRRLKQPATWFIAATDDDDFLLSVDQQGTGVWLEQAGCEPVEKIADSVEAFLQLCIGALRQ